jgi:hypothetical protein
VAVRLSDSFVIEKLASAIHLLDEDEDEDVNTLEISPMTRTKKVQMEQHTAHSA